MRRVGRSPSRHLAPAATANPARTAGPRDGGSIRLLAVLAFVALTAAVLRLPTCSKNIIFIDEAGYFALGARLTLPGAHVYSHTSDQKPPLGPVTYWLASALDDASPLLAVHLLTTLCVAATAVLLTLCSQMVTGSVAPGAVAGTLFALVSSGVPGDSEPWLAFSSLEHFQAPFLVGFVLCFLLGLEKRNLRWALASGISLGIAALFKQNVLVLLLAGWLSAGGMVVRRELRGRTGLALAGASAGAAAGVFLIAPLYYSAIGLAAAWWHGNVAMLLLYHTFSGTWSEEVMILLGLVPLPGLLVAGFVFVGFVLARRRREPATETLSVLLAAGWLVLLATLAGGLHKGHYIVQMLPFHLLLGCMAATEVCRAGHRRLLQSRRVAGILLLGGPLAALSAACAELLADRGRLAQLLREDSYMELHRESGALGSIVSAVASRSVRSDLIYVHSEAPEFYLLTRRRPAVNDPAGSWIAQVASPQLADELLSQLQASPPKLIVELAYRRYGREDQTLGRWPEVDAWLSRAYRPVVADRTVRIIERRGD